MKAFRHILCTFVLALLYLPAISSPTGKVDLAYDVDFDLHFDNREYYRSRFSRSMTIFGARLTPSVGISTRQADGTSHKVMIGIDVMKDFGASPISSEIAGEGSEETSARLGHTDLFRELTLWYNLERKYGETEFSLYAGIFPRRFSRGEYSTAFFSDSLRFYDNNLEGLLLRFKRPKARFELGCDWMGQYGESRREKFMIFSAGEGSPAPVLSLGYAAYMYHFACAEKVDGVVDNILVNPYFRFDFGRFCGLQKFSMRFGWLQAMQHDRRNVGHYVFPCGGEFDLEIRNWNVGLHNRMFYGTDMMPYYNSCDAGGYKYSSRLYMGDPFYRINDDSSTKAGMYDRIEAYYEPYIGRSLSVKVSALFHFHNFRYSGCQQMVSLIFNLQQTKNRQ